MKIKKYTVDNMQEAMNVIKRDLGPNAVIIGSERAPIRSIRDFFRPRQLVVTAAAEEESKKELPQTPGELPEESLPTASTVVRTQPPLNQTGGLDVSRPAKAKKPVIPKSVHPSKLPEPLVDFGPDNHDDWFKFLLHNMTGQGEQGEDEEMDSIYAKWKQVLREMEIHDKITEILLTGLDGSTGDEAEAEEYLKVSLKNRIIKLVAPAYKNGHRSGKVLTFVGPTGVGKTTTLVKLATRYQVFHQKTIALVALYDHRFGSLEELNYYAEIMGAPVEIVMTPGELAQALQKHQDKDYIFIDTEGRPSKNTGQILELKSFLDAVGNEQEILLVLSATTKSRDIMRIARDFRRASFTSVVFTKLDETDMLGSMLNVICEVGVPVNYITNGQNIPDDIETVTPKRLANLILEGLDRSEVFGF